MANEPFFDRNKIFDTRLEQRFFSWYYRFFSIKEIEESLILQWVFGAILFGFYITFFIWSGSPALTLEAVARGTHLCWPFFQNCGDWLFLSRLPFGYSQTTLYMFFFAVMILTVFMMWQKDWILAHMLMGVLFLWEAAAMLITMTFMANFWYFHLVFTLILLLFPYKLFFLRFIFVLAYFVSGSVKIHEGWILGTYFSALKTGLPFFPDVAIPFITNLVIFMEIVGSWFLLSSNRILQRLALGYFMLFHLYSGILVRYLYPTIILPLLLILFGPRPAPMIPPFNKKALGGLFVIISLFALQSLSLLMDGDKRITLEGNGYGLYMFEANHQCISNVNIYKKDGTIENETKEYFSARYRCNPYRRWFYVMQQCKREKESIDHIEWQFDHSINGGPFYRIVDENDVCSLEYKPFTHNPWIKLPEKEAPIIGYPVKNYYY